MIKKILIDLKAIEFKLKAIEPYILTYILSLLNEKENNKSDSKKKRIENHLMRILINQQAIVKINLIKMLVMKKF